MTRGWFTPREPDRDRGPWWEYAQPWAAVLLAVVVIGLTAMAVL